MIKNPNQSGITSVAEDLNLRQLHQQIQQEARAGLPLV